MRLEVKALHLDDIDISLIVFDADALAELVASAGSHSNRDFKKINRKLMRVEVAAG